jgi:TonB family protein
MSRAGRAPASFVLCVMCLANNPFAQSAAPKPKVQSAVPGPLEQNAHNASADAPPPARAHYLAPVLDRLTAGAHPQFTVRIVIDETGRVAESRLVSMKAPELNSAAADAAAEAVLAAIGQWQFEKPVRAPLAMTVVLKIDPPTTAGDPTVTEQPAPIDVHQPEYTEAARARKVEGDVQIEASLDTTGRVTATKVVQPLAPDLDQAAADAIRASTFRPGMRNGAPVPVTITMTMRFKLE